MRHPILLLLLLLLLHIHFAAAQVGIFNSDRYVTTTVVSGFSSSNRYYTADGTGPNFNLTNYTLYVVHIPTRNQTTNNIQALAGRGGWSSNRGEMIRSFQGDWRLVVDQDNITNGATAYTLNEKQAQSTNVSWDEAGKIRVDHFVFNGNVLKQYRNGCLLGWGGVSPPGLTKSSIVNPMPTEGFGIGGYAGASATLNRPYEGGIITVGVSTSTGLTEAQVKAHYNAILANVYASFSGQTHLWRASDAGATWTDTISGLVATRFGSPTISTQTVAFYPYYDVHEEFGITSPILPALTGTVRVGFWGDSRTADEASIRLAIYQSLSSWATPAGLTIKPVGRFPFTSNLDYVNGYGYLDKNNGFSGQSAQQICQGSGQFSTIANELVTWGPIHVAVIWLGQNAPDVAGGEQQWMTCILDAMYANNPSMRVLVLSEISGIRQSAASGLQQQSKFDMYDAWKKREISRCKNRGQIIEFCRITETVRWNDDADWPSGDNVHLFIPTYADPTVLRGYNRVGQQVVQSFKYLLGYN